MSLYSAANLRAGLRDFLLGRLAAAMLSFIANILLVRLMTEDAYADYATLTGLQLTLLLFVSFGVERVMSRFAGEGAMKWSHRDLTRLVGGGLALRAIAVVTLAAILSPFSEWLSTLVNVRGWKNAAPAFWTYTLFFGLFEVLQAIAQSFMLQKAIRLSLILQWGLRVLVVVTFVILDTPLGLIEVLWIFAATSVIPSLVLMPAINRVIAGRPAEGDVPVAEGHFSAVLLLGWHNHMEKLASLPTSAAFMRLIAANALPTIATASYGFYQTLWGVFHRHMPTTISMGMLEAVMAGRYAERRDLREINVVTSAMFKINLLVLVPLVAWLAVSGSDIVTLITGGKYAEQSWALAVIVAGLIPAGLWQLLIAHANTVSMSHVLSRSALLTSLTVPPLAWGVFVFPNNGLLLLALAIPFFGVFQAGLSILFLRYYRLPFYVELRGVLVQLLSALVAGGMAYCCTAANPYLFPLFRIALSGVIVGICVIGVVYVLKLFDHDEFCFLEKFHAGLAGRFSWMSVGIK